MSRKLIAGLLIILGLLLIELIINSSKLAVLTSQRDTLSAAEISLIRNHLDDTAVFLADLADGPAGAGDSPLGSLNVIEQEALLLKHSGIYEVYDDAPGFNKSDFQFGDALSELQLVSYNLEQRMSKYHYQASEKDKQMAKNLSLSVHDMAQHITELTAAAYSTSGKDQVIIKAYQAKADIVTKQATDLVAALLQE
ncbi:MAG: hypothetical protein M0Z55_12600 [Peptococcaceae bacterium]|nr:hypothetical protein [Peptococcaceae bacterium]